MGGGVPGHKALVPAIRSPLLIIGLDGMRIGKALISEKGSKPVQPFRVGINQKVPVIVADFVTEVPQQGAISFPHFHAGLLTPHGIRFIQGDGDLSIRVPGPVFRIGRHHLVRINEIKHHPRRRRVDLALHRKLQAQQTVDQPMFGEFQRPPPLPLLNRIDVRDVPVQLAGHTQPRRRRGVHQPIADALTVIPAEGPRIPLRMAPLGQPFSPVMRNQRHQLQGGHMKADRATTAFATRIFKVQNVPAPGTGEQLHKLHPAGCPKSVRTLEEPTPPLPG